MVAGGGEYGGESGFAGGVVVWMADVSAGHEVAFGVGGDEDVGAVLSDYADDFAAEGMVGSRYPSGKSRNSMDLRPRTRPASTCSCFRMLLSSTAVNDRSSVPFEPSVHIT